jgi:hypothetical protein
MHLIKPASIFISAYFRYTFTHQVEEPHVKRGAKYIYLAPQFIAGFCFCALYADIDVKSHTLYSQGQQN